MPQIRNCPFCQNRGKVIQFEDTDMHTVICKYCYYTTDVAYPTKELAVEEWNTQICQIKMSEEEKGHYLTKIRNTLI